MNKYINAGKELSDAQKECIERIDSVLSGCGYINILEYARFYGIKKPIEALRRIINDGGYGSIPNDSLLFNK